MTLVLVLIQAASKVQKKLFQDSRHVASRGVAQVLSDTGPRPHSGRFRSSEEAIPGFQARGVGVAQVLSDTDMWSVVTP